MKTIKELLIIVRDNIQQDILFTDGICLETYRLHAENIIDYDEYYLLVEFLNNNTPLTKNVIIDRILELNFTKPLDATYWWKYGDKKPRIKWLNKHIKRLS